MCRLSSLSSCSVFWFFVVLFSLCISASCYHAYDRDDDILYSPYSSCFILMLVIWKRRNKSRNFLLSLLHSYLRKHTDSHIHIILVFKITSKNDMNSKKSQTNGGRISGSCKILYYYEIFLEINWKKKIG